VRDDGPGFRLDEVDGAGLQNMEDRMGALAGELAIVSAPGRGTTVSGRVPLDQAGTSACRVSSSTGDDGLARCARCSR
jgi:signal transduction histidine kinase